MLPENLTQPALVLARVLLSRPYAVHENAENPNFADVLETKGNNDSYSSMRSQPDSHLSMRTCYRDEEDGKWQWEQSWLM